MSRWGVVAADLAKRIEHAPGEHPGVSLVHLLEQHHRVHPLGQGVERLDSSLLHRRRRAGPVLEIEPVQFPRRLPGLDHQRLGVGKSPALGRLKKMAQVNEAHLAKRAHQLVPLTVLAGEAHRENRSHAKRRQIVQNGSATTGLRTNVGHVKNLQPGLNGSFSSARGRSRDTDPDKNRRPTPREDRKTGRRFQQNAPLSRWVGVIQRTG